MGLMKFINSLTQQIIEVSSENPLPVTGGDGAIPDGADVAQGSLADAAVTTDTDGTLSAKLRGLIVLILSMSAKLPTSVAHNAADSGNPLKVGLVYRTTAPTLDDGDRGDVQGDVNGNLKTVEAAVEARSFAHVFGTDVDLSVKAASGNICSVVVTNINAAIRYLQIHNKATAPANPDVPILSIPISAGSATLATTLILGEDFFGKGGMALATGIAIGISTTNATFTAATTTDHNFSVSYI